jgi:hypothetical protein
VVERGIADPKVTRSTRVGSFFANKLAYFVNFFGESKFPCFHRWILSFNLSAQAIFPQLDVAIAGCNLTIYGVQYRAEYVFIVSFFFYSAQEKAGKPSSWGSLQALHSKLFQTVGAVFFRTAA